MARRVGGEVHLFVTFQTALYIKKKTKQTKNLLYARDSFESNSTRRKGEKSWLSITRLLRVRTV